MNRRFWPFSLLTLLVAFILGGCSGGVYTASRSELDGDPVVREGSKEPSPPGAVETFWTPDHSVTTAPPTPKNEEILKQDLKEEIAVVHTPQGDIQIKLYDKVTPQTVANFKSLIKDGFYNQTTFHRVVPGFVIQGGDPISRDLKGPREQQGTGGAGYTVPQEIALPHVKGAVAMARLGNDVNPEKKSNGSQFYICLETTPSLDGDYTVFGQVEEGMDVVEKIAAVNRDDRDNPKDRVEMTVTLKKRLAKQAE
jgi:cyclophilin family peptidyl-prolyl cis-trans isomerase